MRVTYIFWFMGVVLFCVYSVLRCASREPAKKSAVETGTEINSVSRFEHLLDKNKLLVVYF